MSKFQSSKTIAKTIINVLENFAQKTKQDSTGKLDAATLFSDLKFEKRKFLDELEHKFNLKLSVQSLWEYPNIEVFAQYVAEQLGLMEKNNSVYIQHEHLQKQEPIAIVGIGCRLPGNVHNVDDFWQLMLSGADPITEVPLNRWDINEYYDADYQAPGKMNTRFGGFLDNVDLFDAAFFNISPKEAQQMDPQQRLFLEVAWQALEHGALKPEKLKQTSTGVFVGVSMHDYERLIIKLESEDKTDKYSNLGNAFSAIGARLSYFLGINGPSFAIDTAQSSSMAALYQACSSIRSGDCDLVIAGGVNLILDPDPSIGYSKANMMAPDGRCKAFDEKANGYVRSEGCGVVILKSLDKAIADKNQIFAVIKSTVANQDGASRGISAPNMLAQKQMLQDGLFCADLKPDEIDFFETHGTGTFVGDPIEVGAINQVYATKIRKEPLYLGAIKSQIGHCEAASGIVGIIKAVLVLQHQQVPVNLHFNKPNPALKLDEVPCVIPTKPVFFKGTKMKRAVVSSYGFTGTNTHAVLEQAPAVKSVESQVALPQEYPFVLSAKNKKSLFNLIEKYRTYLTQTSDRIADICYTLAVGRSHFKYRVAFKVSSITDLLTHLDKQDVPFQVVEVKSQEFVSKNISEIINAYTSGKNINWPEYYAPYTNALFLVSLPTYCFDTQRYWVELPKTEKDIDWILYRNGVLPKPGSPFQAEQEVILAYYQQQYYAPSVVKTSLEKTASFKANSVNTKSLISSWPEDESSRKEALQELISFVAAQVLGVGNPQDININQDFFEMGMNSLLAVELHNKLQQELGQEVEVQASAVSDYPTVGSIRDYIYGVLFEEKTATAQDESAYSAADFIMPDSFMEPLNFIQFALRSGFSKNFAHTISVSLEILSEQNVDVLINIIENIVFSHPDLWFYFDDKYPMFQFTGINKSWRLTYIDISNKAQEQQEIILQKYYNKNAKNDSLRKYAPPLITIHLFKTKNNKFELQMHLAHVLSDLMSVKNFINELLQLMEKKIVSLDVTKYKDEFQNKFNSKIYSMNSTYFCKTVINRFVREDIFRLPIKQKYFDSVADVVVEIPISHKMSTQLSTLVRRFNCPVAYIIFAIFTISISKIFNKDHFNIVSLDANRDNQNLSCYGFYVKGKLINVEATENIHDKAQRIINQIAAKLSKEDQLFDFIYLFTVPRSFYKSRVVRFFIPFIRKIYFKKKMRGYYSGTAQNIYSVFALYNILDLIRTVFLGTKDFNFVYNDLTHFSLQPDSENTIKMVKRGESLRSNKLIRNKFVVANISTESINYNFLNWPSGNDLLKNEFTNAFLQTLKDLQP